MTTGVEIAMSRDRNAFPRCHASSALKWESTRVASVLAMVSSYRIGGISFVVVEIATEGRTSSGGVGIGLTICAILGSLCDVCF